MEYSFTLGHCDWFDKELNDQELGKKWLGGTSGNRKDSRKKKRRSPARHGESSVSCRRDEVMIHVTNCTLKSMD